MEKSFMVPLQRNPRIFIDCFPGHFATSSAHCNYYLNFGNLKYNAAAARAAGRELAMPYLSSVPVETIVCMEKTDIIGAYLAEELLLSESSVINKGGNINVVTPLGSVDGKLLFTDNVVKLIENKKILLLLDTVSSGHTLALALECLSYYGGESTGISALFAVSPNKQTHDINALFVSDDIPGYISVTPAECKLCKAEIKLDAIIRSEGYKKI